jgi:hypothetical protein
MTRLREGRRTPTPDAWVSIRGRRSSALDCCPHARGSSSEVRVARSTSKGRARGPRAFGPRAAHRALGVRAVVLGPWGVAKRWRAHGQTKLPNEKRAPPTKPLRRTRCHPRKGGWGGVELGPWAEKRRSNPLGVRLSARGTRNLAIGTRCSAHDQRSTATGNWGSAHGPRSTELRSLASDLGAASRPTVRGQHGATVAQGT